VELAFLSFPQLSLSMKLNQPRIRPHPQYGLNRSTGATPPGLQGSAMPGSSGGTVANGTTYRQIVNVAGCNNVRVRLLTVGATGTLNIKPIRPVATLPNDESVIGLDGEIDTTKVVAYGTGAATAPVVAATELKLDLALLGENYVMVEFVCTANGSITWCDVCTLLQTS
jgi:hypothetical protein